MRIALFLALFLTFGRSSAVTYYVASGGNDAFSGLSPDSAWRTLEKLSAQQLAAGDSVLFKSADIFRGTYYLNADGSLLEQIYIGVYNGSSPAVISGSKLITNWNLQSGNTYVATEQDAVKGLFVNGILQTAARYPNKGFLKVDEAYGNSGFKSNALIQPDGFWNNATVRIRTSAGYFEKRIVQNFSGATVSFSQSTDAGTVAGNGFYFDGIPALLDTAHEWSYDGVDHQLFYKPGAGFDPNTLAMEAVVYDYGIYCSTPLVNVSINNISFTHQAVSGIYASYVFSNGSISSCDFNAILETGITLDGNADHTIITGNTFSNILSTGIRTGFVQNSSIGQSTFTNIGLIPGAGKGGSEQGSALYITGGSGNRISYNNIDSAGGYGIYFIGANDTIERNIITNAVMVSDNQSGIFSTGTASHDNVIEHNIIEGVRGDCELCDDNVANATGIILGSGCSTFLISHNTVSLSDRSGLRIDADNTNHLITGNMIYGCGVAQIEFSDYYSIPASQQNILVNSNLLYCLSANQSCFLFDSQTNNFVFPASDDNYLINPYNYAVVTRTVDFGQQSKISFPISQWTINTTNDSNSTASYFFLQSFQTTDTLGADLIVNGEFSNNYNQWYVSPDTVAEMLLDNSNQMDGGSVKLQFNLPVLDSAQINSAFFLTEPHQLYQISYSAYGLDDGEIGPAVLQTDAGYSKIGYDKWLPVSSMRKDYVDHFIAKPATQHQWLRIVTHSTDSVVWFDNIHLFPVTGIHLDSTFYSRLLVNKTSSPVTYNFGDSTFYNLDSVKISSVTVQPFESVVVIYVPDELNISVKPLRNNSMSIHVWPNPSADFVNIRIECATRALPFEITDAKGSVVSQGLLEKCGGRIPIDDVSSGLYMLRIVGDNGVYRRSVVVSR